MRILGIDYGQKYIGLAISDKTCLIASPYRVIEKDSDNVYKPVMAEIKKIIKEEDIGLIVLGLPKNMDNTEGDRCVYTRLFKEKLHKHFKSMEVVLFDERFSTNSANRVMREMNFNVDQKNDNIDMIASSFILQNYLDFYNKNK